MRQHPPRDGAEDAALSPDAARTLVALWDGFVDLAGVSVAVRG